MEIRLQKFLAEAGIASRRRCEELIKQGRVKINGIITEEMGSKVAIHDIVEVDNKVVKIDEQKVYIVLNKPIGYVSTVKDQFNRKTVIDLLRGIQQRVFPVGRLDYDTSGLIILTNDGDFTYKLTHPKHMIDKTYMAEISGRLTDPEIKMLENGLEIEDYITSPARIKVLECKKHSMVVEITIHEGKNRQVRKMFEKTGHKVISLKRISIGQLTLEGLPEGKWRYLERSEFKKLGI